jgi:formamidopyrimidine-DNA glycosylase
VPELPEVETVRRGLDAEVVGRKVISVDVTGMRTVRRYGPEALVAGLEGRVIDSTARRGKYLLLSLDGEDYLVIHLRMSGQLLLVHDPSLPLALHTHVRVGLDDGRELRFVDPRTFGEVFVSGGIGDNGLPVELGRVGVDPLVDDLTGKSLAAMLAGRRSFLKVALLDQHLIAGIGNIYGDEILFRAKVRPDRRSGTVTSREAGRIARETTTVLTEAVGAGGSTLNDARYTNLMGEWGSFQHQHAVYGREGKPCARCGRPIKRVRLGGRSSFYCEHCQV